MSPTPAPQAMWNTSASFSFNLPLRSVLPQNLRIRYANHVDSRRYKTVRHTNHYVFSRAIASSSPPLAESNADVRIRRATANDIPTACHVLLSVYVEDFLSIEWVPVPILEALLPFYELLTWLEVSNQLRRRIPNSKHAFFLAEVGNITVGCAEVGVLDIGNLTNGKDEVKEWGRSGGEAYVGNLGVIEPYRGRGIGRLLLERTQDVAKEEWGLACVWLCVEAQNNGAVRFYERLGYGCVAQEPDWFDQVGKRRRLFLCSSQGMQVGEWDKAKIVGGKLGILQYLRYCLWDLRRRREETEGNV